MREGDLVAIIEGNDTPKVYMVQRTEDLVYDYTFLNAVGTLALGSSEIVDNLNPKQQTAPARQMYQVHAGIDDRKTYCYVQLMAGAYRRAPYQLRVPTATTPGVGYFNGALSPFQDPQFEFYTRYNEKPAFQLYNPWGWTVQPKLSFRGKKLQMYELTAASADYLHLSADRLGQLHDLVIANSIPHRRITAYGIDEGS